MLTSMWRGGWGRLWAVLLAVVVAPLLPVSSPSQVDYGRQAAPVVVPTGRPLIVPAASITKPSGVRRAAGGEDEEDDGEDDVPLRLPPITRRPYREQPVATASATPTQFIQWAAPDSAATSGPLRHALQALPVQQDFEVSPAIGYTLQFSTIADLPAVTAAFIEQAAADGHSLMSNADAAILLALQEAVVQTIRSTAQPQLTLVQWSEAAQLDPSNTPLVLEARQQARRGAVRIGLHSSLEFDGAARPLYSHVHGDEHVAPFLGSLLRMIRPTVVVERGGGSYVTPFLLQALADNAADIVSEAEDAATDVPSNYLLPWYFEQVAGPEGAAPNTNSNARLRQEILTPVLHCIHSGDEAPKAPGVLSQLGLEPSLLELHRVALDDVPGFANDLADSLSSAVDLVWFGYEDHGRQDPRLLSNFIDAYVPLLKKDQGYFVVQFTQGFFGRSFGEEIPWSDGVDELRSRIQVAANADLRANQTDSEGQEERDDTGTDEVQVEMINLVEPHKWRAGSLSLFKLSRVGVRAPLGNVLLSQQIRQGFDALARQTPTEAAAHFNGGVQIAEQYQLNPADAEFGQGVALSLATKKIEAPGSHPDEESTLSAVSEAAIDAFKRAIDSDPNHAAARNNLAMLLARADDRNKQAEAIEHLEHAVNSAPTWPKAYHTWGKIHADAGDREKELEVYELALQNGVAWGSILQRPGRFLRGLPAQEFYNPSSVTLLPAAEAAAAAAQADVDLSMHEHWVTALEKEWLVIRDEALSALAAHGQKARTSAHRPVSASQSMFGSQPTGLLGLSGDVVTEAPGALARHVGTLISETGAKNAGLGVAGAEASGRGLWSEIRLLDEGRLANPTAWENFPHTMKVVANLLGEDPLVNAAGVVKFSWLAPGARIISHVGPHNLRLRLHLGLVVPTESAAVQIRVGNTKSQWVEGKALIFDESFEHEVWNNATTPRLVLIIDVWQPALAMDTRRKLLALRERWKWDERSFIDGLHQAPSG